jgi:hypothetical protein
MARFLKTGAAKERAKRRRLTAAGAGDNNPEVLQPAGDEGVAVAAHGENLDVAGEEKQVNIVPLEREATLQAVYEMVRNIQTDVAGLQHSVQRIEGKLDGFIRHFNSFANNVVLIDESQRASHQFLPNL